MKIPQLLLKESLFLDSRLEVDDFVVTMELSSSSCYVGVMIGFVGGGCTF